MFRRLYRLSRDLRAVYRGADTSRRVRDLDGWLDRAATIDSAELTYDHAETVREYYDICGEFMAFGWGDSLHFAPLSPGESLEQSKARHQRLMISRLGLREGMTVIDVGCGIGGPMRRVVQEGRVRVVGVNYSEVQLNKAMLLNKEVGIERQVDYVLCDFMDMGVIADNSFDAGYAIESTCHASDKVAAFAEIYRVLKPGALFWGQEMCMTDSFDPRDSLHQAIKLELMRGIALKTIPSMGQVNRDLEKAGFQVMEGRDWAVGEKGETGETTQWYQPMEAHHGTVGNSLYRVPLGRKLFLGGARLAEAVGVFPKGSSNVIRLLDRTANAYVAGGRAGIFTPLYCFLARKPE